MSGKRRILKHNNSVNSIDAHEDCIAQALSDNSFRLNSINNRINVFQQDKKETTRSAKEIEWKKLFLSLEHEERAIMQDLQSISENIVPGGNTTYSMNPNESDAILSLRLESTASQILQDLEGKPAEEKNNYLAAGVELDSEFDSIEQEVVLLKELVRHNCRNNIGILSNRLHLPTIVAKRLDEVKEEFRFAPQDLALDTYIDQVSNQIEENFRHVSNDQVYTRKEDREGTIHAKPAKWDERSQMILRNAMKQWSKNTTNYDKQRFLQQVAKETGKDITICKQMWHFLHSQNGRGRNGKISENERCWNDLTKIALEDIDIVRQNVINELVSDYQRYLSTEIGIESSHKLRLLQSLRTLSEERRRGDEERLQILQCEEERVLLSKRIAEREAAGRKLEMYLMDKENGNRQARVDEMKMLEEEEIDRARRLAVNSERYSTLVHNQFINIGTLTSFLINNQHDRFALHALTANNINTTEHSSVASSWILEQRRIKNEWKMRKGRN
jgi:hypothetical protein